MHNGTQNIFIRYLPLIISIIAILFGGSLVSTTISREYSQEQDIKILFERQSFISQNLTEIKDQLSIMRTEQRQNCEILRKNIDHLKSDLTTRSR